jgi:WD40 repeat protein
MKLVEGGSLAEQLAAENRRIEEGDHGGGADGPRGDASPSKAPPGIEHLTFGRHEPMQVAKLVSVIAGAVHYAHQRGVLHRDLKPGNILLDAEGEPHLTDFGLARIVDQDSSLTRSVAVMGTPDYMAPEVAAGLARQVTTAADIFSLGAILYELLTGHRPFRAETSAATLQLVIHSDPASPRAVNPKVPPDLATICLRCLEKELGCRYSSAAEVAGELDRFVRGEPILARPASRAERAWRWCRRQPVLAALVAALVAVFAIGLGGIIWKWRAEVHQRQVAEREHQRARNAVTRLEIERAEWLLQSDDSSEGLANLARLLREQPTNHVVAERLMSALTFRSFCLPVAPLRHGHSLNSLTGEPKRKLANRFAFAYPGSLIAANFSPDGSRVVTASEDGTARLWNALDGESLGQPMRHQAEVLWAQFSSDGQKIVTASVDRSARIWQADSGQPATPPLRHDDIVHYAAFRPDGLMVVTASRDKTVRLWNARTGQQVGESLVLPEAGIFACFSPDGSLVLTADESARARVWDAGTGAAVGRAHHFFFPRCPAPFPRFSPSQNQLATVLWHAGLLADPKTNLVISRVLRHDDFVTGIDYSPDGRHVATVSNDGTARIWDADTGDAFTAPLRHDGVVLTGRFSADGQRFVTASRDKTARVWEAATGQALTEPIQQVHAVLSANISADGRRVVTISDTDHGWLWDVRVLQPLTILKWLPVKPQFARFSPDGRLLVVVDDSEVARVCSMPSGRFQTGALKHGRGIIWDAQFSPDSRRVATTSEDRTTRLWDTSTGAPVGKPLPYSVDAKHLRFSPDGTSLIVAYMDGVALLWDVETGRRLFELRHLGRMNSVEFSQDGKWIVTASADATARVWDAATGHAQGQPLGHGADVFGAVIDRAAQRVATASKDKTVRIWSLPDGRMLTPPLVHADALNPECSVTFSPDGSRLATAAGSSVQVWDAGTGRAVTISLKHGGLVKSVQFSPDGRKLLTACEDGNARLWDPETGQPVSEPLRHGLRVHSAEFSPNGTQVVTCSPDKTIRIWALTAAPLPVPEWLPALAEAVAGQRINPQHVSEVVPVDELYRLRQQLGANSEQSHYARWARWFFDESATRTISPSSALTVPDYVQLRIDDDTQESLQEAAHLSATNALAFARLAQKLIATKRTKQGTWEDADWFSRYATNLAPHDAEVLQIREVVVKKLQATRVLPKP